MDDQLKENITSGKTWKRALYMLIFAIAFNISEILIAATVLLELVLVIFTGKTNPRLKIFGQSLSKYVYQIVRFLTYNTEEMPYPFAPWPLDSSSDVAPAKDAQG